MLAGLALLIDAVLTRQPLIGSSDASHRGDDATSSAGELSPPLPRYTELSSSTLAVALQRLRLIDDQGGRLGDAFTRQQTEATLERLLRHLQVLRVSVVILEPDQSSAQCEWNHRRREIRLHPRVLDAGLERFATTLQHEVLHIIQSCASDRGSPAANLSVVNDLRSAMRLSWCSISNFNFAFQSRYRFKTKAPEVGARKRPRRREG